MRPPRARWLPTAAGPVASPRPGVDVRSRRRHRCRQMGTRAIAIAAALGVFVALTTSLPALAGPAGAPTAVATKLQLRGHLPDLGDRPELWVFATASAYDAFRVKLDIADVLPDSSSLYMTFDKELLALYTRGDDIGGRCLRTGAVATATASIVTLDLSWDASSCGAPASAPYPFALAS